MNSSRMMFRLLLPGALIFAALLLVAGTPGAAQACPAGFTDAGTECQLSGPLTVSGTLTFEKTLHLLAGANLDGLGPIELDITGDLIMDPGTVIRNNDDGDNPAPCGTGGGNGPPTGNNACNIIIVVSGSVDMGAGSIIEAENQVDGGIGGNITMTIGGDLTLHGPGNGFANGALISTRNSGSDGGAGNIRITVGNVTVNSDDTITCDAAPAGSIVMESGSIVTADAVHGGEAGSIKMFAGKDATINGTVSSRGFTTTGRGGPITIDACCNLTVGPTGVVSSRGQDPGADLVHLQGCDVLIQGLVESTGAGHENPNGANLCNDGTHTPGPKSSFFTGCVEIWGGDKVTIDRTPGNLGQVSADIGFTGGSGGNGWIDIFAHNLIQVFGATTGTVFAVHANGGLAQNTDDGGVITIKAGPDLTDPGVITMTGLAVQADAISAGSAGGSITIQGRGNVTLDTASLFARGDFVATGGFGSGGQISVRSFSGTLSWQNGVGNVQPTGATIPAAQRGVITLQDCLAPAGVNTTNTSFPSTGAATTPTVVPDFCANGPTLSGPAATQFEIPLANGGPLVANCTTRCAPPRENKLGVKFNDLLKNGVKDPSDPGLVGWRIDLFDGSGNFLEFTTTNAGPPIGHYGFSLTPGIYTVCEVLQAGWVQTTPSNSHPVPSNETLADCTKLTDPDGLPLGPFGYTFTVTGAPGEQFANDDFGNSQNLCPKESITNIIGAVNTIVTIDPSDPQQLQHTIESANVDDTILIMPHLGKKTENLIINKRLRLFGCSITLTPADSSQPVVSIVNDPADPNNPNTGANGGLTMDIHATGSTLAGYEVDASKHTVRNVRLNGSAIGMLITGNGNLVNGALGTGTDSPNGIGFKITGNTNTLDTNNGVQGNTGDGVQVAGGDGNKVLKYTVRSNGGNGIFVSSSATHTTLQENKAYTNGLNGYLVQGANTTMSKNIAGDIGSGNSGDGIRVDSNGGALSENTSRSNSLVGFRVTGTGHNLSKDVSGGTSSQNNGSCQYVVGASNTNGGSNKTSGGATFTFGSGGANSLAGCVPLAPTP